MTILDLLVELEKGGQLATLYRSGVITVKTYNQRDIVLHYQALLALPQYVDAPADAVKQVMQDLKVCRTSVYAAITQMLQEIPPAIAA